MANEIRYAFDYDGCPDDYLNVVEFDGEEAISTLYRFTITLRCDDPELDPDAMLDKFCWFRIYNGDTELRRISGVLRCFEEVTQTATHSIYQAELVPRLWWLNFYHTNEVYLNMSVPDIIKQVLEESQFTQLDFQFDLIRDYRSWEYRCQFDETHFNFVHRLLEREGIYYYFEQTDQGEKVIFCDHKQFHQRLNGDALDFDPSTGLDVETYFNNVQSLISRRQHLARTLSLRDFNDNTPSLDVRGQTTIADKGIGEINIWGLNIDSPEEGQALADIHADAQRCRRLVFHGESTVPRLQAGFEYTLNKHYRTQYNQDYQLVSLHHHGTDLRFYSASAGQQQVTPDSYRNSFTAIPVDNVQFRPEVKTPKPSIQGTLNAIIDAASDGHYAELDSQGRYHVILPFDRRDKDGAKASHWVRMMQPYGGLQEGMHFPLRKGTRVLLSFIGGDPDRPVISGTMPDAEQPSIVNEQNQTCNLIRTAAGNKIELEDKDGTNRIKFETPHYESYLHLGAPNHAGTGFVVSTQGIMRMDIARGKRISVTTAGTDDALDANHAAGVGNMGNAADKSGLFSFPIKSSTGNDSSGLLSTAQEISGRYLVERLKGEAYNWSQGNHFNFYPSALDGNAANNNLPNDSSKSYYYGARWEVHTARYRDPASGISSPSALIETMKGFGLNNVIDYEGNSLNDTANAPANPTKPTQNSGESDTAYQARVASWESGADHRDLLATYNEPAWVQMLNRSRVRVARHDTFNLQEGNIFDFGGYWNYNLGDSYAENHMNQAGVTLNEVKAYDWTAAGGPYWNTISSPSSLFEEVDTKPNISWAKSDGVWVEKTFDGRSYEYNNNVYGVEINVGCNSVEVKKGGTSWEVKYNGDGDKVYEMKSGGGITEEWTSTPDGRWQQYEKKKFTASEGKVAEATFSAHGNPVSYEIVRQPQPGTKFSFSGDGLPKLSMGFSTDVGNTSFSAHVGGMSNSVSASAMGMKNAISIDMTIMKNNISLSGVALKAKIEKSLGGSLDMDVNFGPLKLESKMRALHAEQEKMIKMTNGMLAVLSTQMELKNELLSLVSGGLEVDGKALKLG